MPGASAALPRPFAPFLAPLPVLAPQWPGYYQPPPPYAFSHLPLPYLFVPATTKSLLLYSTHSCHALAALTNLHLSALTDIAWATPSFTAQQEDKQQAEAEAEQQEGVRHNRRKQWATEDRVLVSSSDGYISIVEMQGVAEKLDGEGGRRGGEHVGEGGCGGRKRLGDGEESELKAKKRKKKTLAAGDAAASAASPSSSAEGIATPPAAQDGETAGDEAEKVKAVSVFELTDEMKAQLQRMVDTGVQVSVDSVREHCQVSIKRATRMARKWKELQRQQKMQQSEAAAKAAAERWEKMDKEQKEKAQLAAESGDGGKEEKAEVTVMEGKGKRGDEAAGDKESERKRKERVKAGLVPAEDAKRIKKIDSFFTKSATPVYPVATPSTSSSSSSSSSSSLSSASCLPLNPLPLLPDTAVAAGGKRKIVPILVDTLTPIESSSHNAAASPTAATSAGKSEAKKKKTKKAKKKSSRAKAGKKAVPAAAPIAASQPSTTAPALFAPAVPQSAAAPAPPASFVSIDLTDEPSSSSPLAAAHNDTKVDTATAAAPTASDATAAPAGAASAPLVSAVAVDVIAKLTSVVVSPGAVIQRQGSGSRRVMADPPSSADESPPVKRPKRTIVPTVIAPQQSPMQQQQQQMEVDSKPTVDTGGPEAVSDAHYQADEMVAACHQPMAVQVI